MFLRHGASYRATGQSEWVALWSDILFWYLVVPFEKIFKIIRYNRFLNILMDSTRLKNLKKSIVFCLKKSRKFRNFHEKWLSRSVLMLKKKKFSQGGSKKESSPSFMPVAGQPMVKFDRNLACQYLLGLTSSFSKKIRKYLLLVIFEKFDGLPPVEMCQTWKICYLSFS